MKIEMTDDFKQELIAALQPVLVEGEKIANEMFDCLVNDWGADKYKIDQIALIEMARAHFMDRARQGLELDNPAKYLADSLAMRSDYGLSKMGLTREQYEAVRYRPNEARI